MKAASLLCVLALAKLCVLAGREVPLSLWTPIAYFWQDALVLLIFAALDRLLRPWVGWLLYGIIAAYAAVNVPVARVLSTPLTWPLLRAARGPLADSILHYVTWTNVALMLLVLTVAVALPFAFLHCLPRAPCGWRPLPRTGALIVCLVLPILVVLGPEARSHIDTTGLERNCIVALVTSAFPHHLSEPATLAESANDWRVSPFAADPGEDLTRLRGTAAGRNVIVIHLESTAAGYLRPYGAAEDPMPHLTQLAGRAIRFENAYAVYPESIKGLFSVLCSSYPALDTQPETYERITTPALPAVFRNAGYHTALFHSGRFHYLGMESIIRNRGYQLLEEAGSIGGEHNSSFGVDEPSTVRRILSWIDSVSKDERFFVTYLPIAGHHPYFVPEPGPFPEQTDLDRYRNALHYSDAALGELLRGLEKRGLDRKTLLVIFGDHGEAFGQHPGNFGHTIFIHEENVRVPFFIVAPGLIQEPLSIRRVASLIDTAPTILDLLGIPAPPDYQGSSLLSPEPRMALFFTDYALAFLGLRDGQWKFTHDVESGRSKLFDLGNDPGEGQDRSPELPERAEKYRGHLLRWAAEQRRRVTK